VKAFVKATKKKRSLGNRLKRYNIKKAKQNYPSGSAKNLATPMSFGEYSMTAL